MLVLTPPVDGPILRPFAYAGSPFRAGLHRGVDLRARPGERVAAPCTGPVAYSGRFGLTLRCGRFRVTLPSVAPGVRRGEVISAGETVGRSKAGSVHLGVRRAGEPFGYVDPEPFLRRPLPAPPVAGPRARRPPPVPRPEPRPAPTSTATPLAPWPAWAGLTLLLAAVGRRRRAARTRARAPASARAGTHHVS